MPCTSGRIEEGTVIYIPSSETSNPLRGIQRIGHLLADLPRSTWLLSHNAPFDLAFLAEALRRADIPFDLQAFCTLRLSRALLPEAESYDLDSLVMLLDLDDRPTHTALADARAVAGLFRLLAERFGLATPADVVAIHGLAVRTGRLLAPPGIEEGSDDAP